MSGGVNLTVRETKLMVECMRNLQTDVSKSIDFAKVATECGYKDATNAKTMFLRLRKKKLSGGSGDEYEDNDDDDRKKKKKSSPNKKTASKRKSEGTVSKRVTKRTKTSFSTKKVNEDDDDDEDGTVSTPVKDQLMIEETKSQDEPNQNNQIEGGYDSSTKSIHGLEEETDSEGNLEPKDPQQKLAQRLVQNSAGESDQDIEQRFEAAKQTSKKKSGRKAFLKRKDHSLVKATEKVGHKADKGTKGKEVAKKTDKADDKLDDEMKDQSDEEAVHQPESEAKLTSDDKSEDDADQPLAKDQVAQQLDDKAEEVIGNSAA